MSIASVETLLAEFVGDVLVNRCGRPVPDRVIRYHTTVPDDCCTEAGALAVSWTECYVTDKFPQKASGTPCSGRLTAAIDLRYIVCWPIPDDPADVTDAEYAAADTVAAMLADVADCVSRAFARLKCNPDADNPFEMALVEETGTQGVEFNGATPRAPMGGCAGVVWRVYCLIGNPPVLP